MKIVITNTTEAKLLKYIIFERTKLNYENINNKYIFFKSTGLVFVRISTF